MSKNYALEGLNFEKFGQIEYSLAKIKAKMFSCLGIYFVWFRLVVLWHLLKLSLTGSFGFLHCTGSILPNLAKIMPGQN